MGLGSRFRNSRRIPVLAVAVIVLGGAWLPLGIASPPHSAQAGSAVPGNSAGSRFGEGPLDNDALLLTDGSAAELFFEGDQSFRAVRSGDNRLVETFEAWRSAVARTAPGAQVPAVDPRLEPVEQALAPRWLHGTEQALAARLELLVPAERTAWRERFEGGAQERLQTALSDWNGVREAELGALERELPGTRAAVRAALALADRGLATGRPLLFATWLERAERQAAWLGDADLIQSARARRAALAAPEPAPDDPPPGHLDWIGRTELGVAAARLAPSTEGRPRLLPGLVQLETGPIAVQGPRGVEIFSFSAEKGLERERSFEPGALLKAPLREPVWAYPTGATPGWQHRPAASGADLILVEGRAAHGIRGSNVLMRVSPGLPEGGSRELRSAEALPELRWAWSGERLVSSASPLWSSATEEQALELLRGFTDVEIQPAPLVLGEVVLATARRLESELEQHLFAFDAETGRPLWRRFLAKGSERGARGTRFGDASRQMAAAPPMGASGTRVALTTGLGTFHLVSALDGRVLLSARLQRTSGDSPVDFEGTQLVATEDQWIAAPSDSEYLYFFPKDGQLPTAWLPPDQDDLRRSAPWARFGGEARALIAGRDASGSGPYIVLEAGGREALARLRAQGQVLENVIEFAPREHLGSSAHLDSSGTRLLLPSDRGLYLFDLERDARLVDAVSWPRASGAAAPGGLAWIHVKGALLLVTERQLFAVGLTP